MEYITLNNGAVITNEVLAGIGQKYGKTPAQVALRALMQKGVVVIPKSTHRDHFDPNVVGWMLGELVKKQQLGGGTLY